MKEVNFRIIELPEHQVLLMKEWDQEEDSPVIVVVFIINGIKISQTFGYTNDEDRDKMFETLSDEQAARLVDGAVELINQG